MKKKILRVLNAANVLAFALLSAAVPTAFAQPTQPLVAIHRIDQARGQREGHLIGIVDPVAACIAVLGEELRERQRARRERVPADEGAPLLGLLRLRRAAPHQGRRPADRRQGRPGRAVGHHGLIAAGLTPRVNGAR